MKPRTRLLSILMMLLTFSALLAGCSASDTNQAAEGQVVAMATTGMVADLVKNIGGEHVHVEALMGPGIDPHLYKASQGDIGKLYEADIVFYNGLHLEGKMIDVFEQVAKQKPAIAVTEKLNEAELLTPPEFDGLPDPHVWFDVQLWAQTVDQVKDGLIEIDPAHRADYEANAADYRKQLEELDAYVRGEVAKIPADQRVLVTAHDAFGYFGEAYGLEVVGLQGISTDSEYGLKDVQNMVSLIVDRQVKAVFIESSVPKKAIEAVVEGAKAKSHDVTVGGELYSDALGDAGSGADTYIGMVKANVNTIVSALQ